MPSCKVYYSYVKILSPFSDYYKYISAMSGTISGYTDNNNNSINYLFKKETVDGKFYLIEKYPSDLQGLIFLYHFSYL